MFSLKQVITLSGAYNSSIASNEQFYKFLKHMALASEISRVNSHNVMSSKQYEQLQIHNNEHIQLNKSSQEQSKQSVTLPAETVAATATAAAATSNFTIIVSPISHLRVNVWYNLVSATAKTTAILSAIDQNRNTKSFHKVFNRNIHIHYKEYSKQQIHIAMSSLAAEPLQAHKSEEILAADGSVSGTKSAANGANDTNIIAKGASCHDTASVGKKPCFNTGLGEILKFMELIGNLKHTKRTGWVLRDVNDCESISGHMYRMSMLTFLLDGSEGLNQIRCMELALVHDLAESLVGDITPFCGVKKHEKRAMEFKAMEDICKLIEPRGKRIMELFEEYEHGESAESKFVKDLDRLDMVMQAFEYEKRDNCLLKHQEFFDSTEGKFNHPFVKKLVNEIYEQREVLAKAKGATPPPPIHVPNMEEEATDEPNTATATSNGEPQTASTS